MRCLANVSINIWVKVSMLHSPFVSHTQETKILRSVTSLSGSKLIWTRDGVASEHLGDSIW